MADDLQPGLYEDDPEAQAPAVAREERPPGLARVRLPNRAQPDLRPRDLDALLPEGHRARVVWAWVEQADLSRMYAGIRAVEGGSGRPAIAPEILFALWLYATLDGVGTARSLARLTQAHDADRWICGGVQVNDHTLSDFRCAHGEAFDA
jgi:transposase